MKPMTLDAMELEKRLPSVQPDSFRLQDARHQIRAAAYRTPRAMQRLQRLHTGPVEERHTGEVQGQAAGECVEGGALLLQETDEALRQTSFQLERDRAPFGVLTCDPQHATA